MQKDLTSLSNTTELQLQCVSKKKLERYNQYQITSSIRNIYRLFLVKIDLIQFSIDYVKKF